MDRLVVPALRWLADQNCGNTLPSETNEIDRSIFVMLSSLRMKRMRQRLLPTLLVGALTCGGIMNDALGENASRTWQTEKAKVLDSPNLINSTARVLNGAPPGTNKPYDAQKVSDELVQMLFEELKEQFGVHAETTLATLGALAGFSVQMSLRETLVKPGKMPEDKVFVIVRTNSGEKLYFGDLPNEGLFGGQPGAYSVYALVGGGAQKAGAEELPNAEEIARYVASTVGSGKFGIPRVPAEHMPHAPPTALLDKFWNPTRNFLVLNVQAPMHWPLVLALAAQNVIVMSKDVVDPAMASKLVMETATAMAKIDPAKVHNAYFQAY